MNKENLLKNEDGSIIVLALVMLILLTFLGTSATNTSTVEVQIAGNERVYKENFYLAEAVALEAAQRLEDAPDSDLKADTTTLSWLKDGELVDMEDTGTMIANSQVSTVDANARFGAVTRGVASGASLDVTGTSQLYEFAVYGMSSNNGRARVVLGFRKRF